MTPQRARFMPRLEQWLAYAGLVVAGGASLATSPCDEAEMRTLESTVELSPGAGPVTKTFTHNAQSLQLTLSSDVAVILEASVREPLAPYEPPTEVSGMGGESSAYVSETIPGVYVVSPGERFMAECQGACSPLTVRVRPLAPLSAPASVGLGVHALQPTSCDDDYAYDIYIEEEQ